MSENNFMRNLLIVVVIIIAIAYFAPDKYEAGKGWVMDKFKEFTAPKQTNQTISLQQSVNSNITIDDDFNLADYYLSNYPDYFDSRSANCIATGGTWIAEEKRVGCYDVPVWDNSLCSSMELQFLKLSCVSIKGIFTCSQHEVSCRV